MEHRQHPRYPVHFKSSFVSANVVSGDGRLVDLSIRGCRIVTFVEVKPGTALELHIEAFNDAPPLDIAQAVVRWSHSRLFGLEFVSLKPDHWARLQQLVKELERQPYQRNVPDGPPA